MKASIFREGLKTLQTSLIATQISNSNNCESKICANQVLAMNLEPVKDNW